MKTKTIEIPKPLTTVACAALLVFSSLVSGCRPSNSIDLLKEKAVIPEQIPSKLVRLPEPSIWAEDGKMVVTGMVRRWPQMNGALTGHIDIVVVSADGEELGRASAIPGPSWIPLKGSRSSSYTVRYSGIPPAGSKVRVAYRNRPHSNDEVTAGGGE